MAVNLASLREFYADAKNEPIRGCEDGTASLLIRPRLAEFYVLDHVYRTKTVTLPADEFSTARNIVDVTRHRFNADIDGPLKPTPVDLNWVLTFQDHNESPIVWQGDIYRFRPVANGPIMSMRRNSHRWDASEFIVPTREDLIRHLHVSGFTRPWLVFGQTRLFQANPRIPDAAIANIDNEFSWSALGREVSGMVKALMNEDPIEEIPFQMMKDLRACGERYRYLVLDVPKAVYHPDTIGRVANFINFVFFEMGVVLLRRTDIDAGVDNYKGRHGDLYHDLKLMVDRMAIFSEGQYATGWAKFIDNEFSLRELFRHEKPPAPGIQRVQVQPRAQVPEV